MPNVVILALQSLALHSLGSPDIYEPLALYFLKKNKYLP